MGTVYRRKNSLWLKYKSADGEWKYQPSGLKVHAPADRDRPDRTIMITGTGDVITRIGPS